MRKRDLGCSVIAIAAALLGAAPAVAQQQAGQAPPAAGAKPAQKEIVVTGTRADVTTKSDRVSFNVGNNLQVQTGTLADALRAVPGVSVDLEGAVSLRGDPGVRILVDGRPSALFSGEGRANAILSMPAGQVERVEVINNPSAAMSPEGSGGVINLVMKQARPGARSATVRANVGDKGRATLSLNGSLSSSKLTATGDLNLRRFAGDAVLDQSRTTIDSAGQPISSSQRHVDFDSVQTGRNGRLGADYDIDKSNRVSGEFNAFGFTNVVDTDERFEAATATQSFDRATDTDTTGGGKIGRLSWRRSLPGEGHELTADLQSLWAYFQRDVDAVVTPDTAAQAFEHIRNAGHRDEHTLKLDYKRPMGTKNSLNVGYEGNLQRDDWDFLGERGDSLATLEPVPGLTNEFDYDQVIHAAYATYDFHIGRLGTTAGLRAEQLLADIDQVTDGLQFENNYFRLYPTLHLNYELNEGEQLRASYSRRIQRPQRQDLNPYTFYIDPFNLLRGNPLLKPEITDSFEASWQRRKGPSYYSLTGFFRTSKDGVTDVFTDLGNGVILTTRSNLGTGRQVGIEAVANGKLSKTLNYNASATLLRNRIDPRVGGISQPNSGTTGTFRGNLSWQPTSKDFFQINGNYSGRQLLPQGYRKPGGVLNLGYRRKINEKLSFLLTGQNLLDSQRQVTVFETETLRNRTRQKGTGRVVLAGIAYTIGSQGRGKKEPSFDFQQPSAGDTSQ